MTLHQVKSILQIKDNTQDDYINAILPLVESFVLQHCRRNDIPPSLQLAVAKIIDFERTSSGLNSKSIGDIRLAYNTEYPENIKTILNDHKLKKVLMV